MSTSEGAYDVFEDKAREDRLRWFEHVRKRDNKCIRGRMPRSEVAGRRPGGDQRGDL